MYMSSGAGVPKEFQILPRTTSYISQHFDGGGRPRLDLAEIALELDVSANWPVRDQTRHPTCVAFAVLACLELALARKNATLPAYLSPAYLYWLMQEEFPPKEPPLDYKLGAMLLGQAKEALKKIGACTDSLAEYPYIQFTNSNAQRKMAWRYPEDPDKREEMLANAKADASLRKPTTTDEIGHLHIPEGPAAASANGKLTEPLSTLFHRKLSEPTPVPVVIAVPTFATGLASNTNWLTTEALSQGIVREPTADQPVIVGGHAVTLVGFKKAVLPGERGWFIFRNSLGLGFARDVNNSPYGIPGPGYGAISADYIDLYCWEYLYFETL